VTGIARIALRNGAAIPPIGLGTWPMNDKQARQAVATALETGYRLIDTAENYGNESGVGEGVRDSGLPREEIFVTTKFNKRWHGVQLVAEAFDRSCERLGLDYLDLLLIHWPNPRHDRYVDAFAGLAKLLDEGRVKAIGVSNFKPAHLDRIITETGFTPDVNQIELNPGVARTELRRFHAKHGIVTESWAPIGGQGTPLLEHPVIIELAREHGRTPAQIVLRWHVQNGLVPIPKSSDPQRLKENLDVFGFELSREDLATLRKLDQGEAAASDSDAYGH
jgi:2,5-diketo-D-gluconate reductase A